MLISIVTHAARGSLSGNRITSNRWAKICRQLGHRVVVGKTFHSDSALAIGIHAEKSALEIKKFQKAYPNRKSIIVISGTDLYGTKPLSASAKFVLANANQLIALEQNAKQQLGREHQAKTTVIRQSAQPPNSIPEKLKSCFEISVCGHLREEKNPFMIAHVCELLPSNSKIRINHIGKALSAKMKRTAEQLTLKTPRYNWLGEKSHWRSRQLIARSRVLVNSSRMESSANSIVEAIVSRVPVLASNVAGNVGVFGPRYKGLFEAGNKEALLDLLRKVESDAKFLKRLEKYCQKIASEFTFENEKRAWRTLLEQLDIKFDIL